MLEQIRRMDYATTGPAQNALPHSPRVAANLPTKTWTDSVQTSNVNTCQSGDFNAILYTIPWQAWVMRERCSYDTTLHDLPPSSLGVTSRGQRFFDCMITQVKGVTDYLIKNMIFILFKNGIC